MYLLRISALRVGVMHFRSLDVDLGLSINGAERPETAVAIAEPNSVRDCTGESQTFRIVLHAPKCWNIWGIIQRFVAVNINHLSPQTILKAAKFVFVKILQLLYSALDSVHFHFIRLSASLFSFRSTLFSVRLTV